MKYTVTIEDYPMLELFAQTMLKSLDVSAIMSRPDVVELLTQVKQAAADFAAIRAQNAEILARLDRLQIRGGDDE